MKSKRKPGILRIYSVEREIQMKDCHDPNFEILALVTERSNLVSEIDPFNGDSWYLKKCEGWQWDAFLVYCTAKGLLVNPTLALPSI